MIKNPYIYDDKTLEKYSKIADKTIDDSKKYEYWYEEIFCSDNRKNTICCQMDNVIYTYYVYRDTKKYYSIMFAAALLGIAVLWAIIGQPRFIVLSIITLFDILQLLVDSIDTCNELIENNQMLREKVLTNDTMEYTDNDIRCIQDCVVNNRNRSLFMDRIFSSISWDTGLVLLQNLGLKFAFPITRHGHFHIAKAGPQCFAAVTVEAVVRVLIFVVILAVAQFIIQLCLQAVFHELSNGLLEQALDVLHAAYVVVSRVMRKFALVSGRKLLQGAA